ncbi:hypothetical protein F5J12DRAFT_366481 [Pisolithus orientalis]|uniref:uncharacterized protein n=1 Tax=Pisolithus orientalis TaxID=936130 RepID=UPI0022255815|nr:uncharacterized protein F5J12DRAFT_366481 [Pisolithus orientalis]KAI5995738.1 hypothetical protein F5J12DRAFT_366481 [Pisolithus orientalis]
MGPHDQILGPLLIGILFNTYLYGIVTYQFALYYRADFNDRLAVKCVVAFLLVLDIVHSIALIYMVWVYMVANYTNPTTLQLMYGIVITMALPTFGLGIACGIEAWFIHVLADMPRINGLATAWIVMQVIVDTFLTGQHLCPVP